MSNIEAVIFDLDGVLVDSEHVWDEARRALTDKMDARWPEGATQAMMGMSSIEWSRYIHDAIGLPLEPAEISRLVVARMEDLYRQGLPLIPGAQAAVQKMAARWRLGLASSSNRELIDLVLDLAELRDEFQVTVSSEEVERGKPSPDVYLEAAHMLGVPPDRCIAIEDSGNGIRSGKAAGMLVIAIPNLTFPPEPDSLALADRVLGSLKELSPELIESVI
jgi:HAD superfamily hydrolase (TIGR01509 family)